MNKRFLIFISIILLMLGLAAFYAGVRLISWSPWLYARQSALWLALLAVIVLQLIGPYLYRAYPRARRRLAPLQWIIYMALGAFVALFLYVLMVDLAAFWMGRDRELNRWRIGSSVGLAALTVALGWMQIRRGPKIYEADVPIAGLPEAFDGFRIVQISDLHVGPTIGIDYARKVVDRANSLKPDLVALTGDFIDGTREQLEADLRPLADLRAQAGIFFVTGNHEYYWNVHDWTDVFRNLGARVLLNEHVRLEKGGAELSLAGVTDLTAGRMLPEHACDPQRAIAGASPQAVKILLAHNPDTYKTAHSLGYALQLSGHTHGGQFFPWSLIVKLVHPYCKGLYRHEGMWLYVNRGTGYWGPPIRFTVPTEITLLRLRRA